MLIIMVTITAEQTVPVLAEVVVQATIVMQHGAALLVRVTISTMQVDDIIVKVDVMVQTVVIMQLIVMTVVRLVIMAVAVVLVLLQELDITHQQMIVTDINVLLEDTALQRLIRMINATDHVHAAITVLPVLLRLRRMIALQELIVHQLAVLHKVIVLLLPLAIMLLVGLVRRLVALPARIQARLDRAVALHARLAIIVLVRQTGLLVRPGHTEVLLD